MGLINFFKSIGKRKEKPMVGCKILTRRKAINLITNGLWALGEDVPNIFDAVVLGDYEFEKPGTNIDEFNEFWRMLAQFLMTTSLDEWCKGRSLQDMNKALIDFASSLNGTPKPFVQPNKKIMFTADQLEFLAIKFDKWAEELHAVGQLHLNLNEKYGFMASAYKTAAVEVRTLISRGCCS